MLRNIFDQYHQPENHITHGLFLVLLHNPKLLRAVLGWKGIELPEKGFKLLTQKAPKKTSGGTTVPDGYIYSDDYEICIGVETKIVPDTLRVEQLAGHLEILREYPTRYLLILAPEPSPPPAIDKFIAKNTEVSYVPWPALMEYIAGIGPDSSKEGIGVFLYNEFFKHMERKHHMTPFQGFNFDEGYDAKLAVHYVKRVVDLLNGDMKNAYPECENRRQSIGRPWQAWFSTPEVQNSVHPAFAVQPDMIRCNIVLGNGCRREWKQLSRKLESMDPVLNEVLERIYTARPEGARAAVSFRQRHYRSQRSQPTPDGETTISISTLLGVDGSKTNSIWWDHLRAVARTKNDYNYQLELGYDLRYDDCPQLRDTGAVKLMSDSFQALRPAYDLLIMEDD